jgi:hypothetical protein
MRITFKATYIGHSDPNIVTLSFPDVKPLLLDGVSSVSVEDPGTGIRRQMTMDEMRDFEDAVEKFVHLRTVKAIAAYIVETQY